MIGILDTVLASRSAHYKRQFLSETVSAFHEKQIYAYIHRRVTFKVKHIEIKMFNVYN